MWALGKQTGRAAGSFPREITLCLLLQTDPSDALTLYLGNVNLPKIPFSFSARDPSSRTMGEEISTFLNTSSPPLFYAVAQGYSSSAALGSEVTPKQKTRINDRLTDLLTPLLFLPNVL